MLHYQPESVTISGEFAGQSSLLYQDSCDRFVEFRLADGLAQIGLNPEFHAAGYIAATLGRGEQDDGET